MSQARLPATLQLIADAIGLAAALELCRDLGGTEVYVADRPRAGSPIVRSIGADKAAELARRIGAGTLLVPLGPSGEGVRKREAIARDLASRQYSHQQIARRCSCHVRTVYRIAARMDGSDGDDRQASLFGS